MKIGEGELSSVDSRSLGDTKTGSGQSLLGHDSMESVYSSRYFGVHCCSVFRVVQQEYLKSVFVCTY